MTYKALLTGRYRLIVSLLFLTAGCGSRANRASVTGTVRLDGLNVESGSITFLPAPGNSGPTAGAAIVQGRYSVEAAKGPVVGPNIVELSSSRKTGRQKPTPMLPDQMMDEVIEAFPADCNIESQLVRQIVPGHNEIDFDLQSVERRRDAP